MVDQPLDQELMKPKRNTDLAFRLHLRGEPVIQVFSTLKRKIDKIAEISSAIKTPGPGAYRSIEVMNPKGRYAVSKFKNSGATVFPPSRSQRFASGLNRGYSNSLEIF